MKGLIKMNELTVRGKQEFMGIEIPVIYGGFGEGQKVMLARDIAEIHNTELKNINQNINRNIKRFRENVDIIDLKLAITPSDCHTRDVLLNLGFNQSQINASKNIYLLSERGYAKLIKIMDTDLAWEIHDKLIDEYFQLREQKEQEQQTLLTDTRYAEALLELYDLTGHDKNKTLNIAGALQGQAKEDITINIEAVEEPAYKPHYYSITELANSGLVPYYTTMSINSILREKGILTNRKNNKPYQKFIDNGYFEYGIIKEYDKYDYRGEPVRRKGWILTPKGWEWIIQLLKED